MIAELGSGGYIFDCQSSARWVPLSISKTEEINDLFVEGGEFVDRLYYALRESGLPPERSYRVREANVEYVASLAVLCREGVLGIEVDDSQPHQNESLLFPPDAVLVNLAACLQTVHAEVDRRGGVQPYSQRNVSS
jgi:hypothetical protein